ncbi:hypothetical protein J3Q64DRAFT_1695586 [Phycomyces blakesleeanus]|uniref:Uncharacterized protein n=1 Tax=Phycomyces blakesleeanus TaxID=4837 RepID=A0ABR3B6C7_PHYBL
MQATLVTAIEIVHFQNIQTHAANAIQFNKLCKAPDFHVGQEVLVFTRQLSRPGRSRKLSRAWKGPYEIEAISHDQYSLRPSPTSNHCALNQVHAQRIKAYHRLEVPVLAIGDISL